MATPPKRAHLPATRVLLITASSGRTTIRTVGSLSEFRAHPAFDRNDIPRFQFACVRQPPATMAPDNVPITLMTAVRIGASIQRRSRSDYAVLTGHWSGR